LAADDDDEYMLFPNKNSTLSTAIIITSERRCQRKSEAKTSKTSTRPFTFNIHSFIHFIKKTPKHSIHYHSQALKESQKKTHNDK
jgi:hypothetical protein